MEGAVILDGGLLLDAFDDSENIDGVALTLRSARFSCMAGKRPLFI